MRTAREVVHSLDVACAHNKGDEHSPVCDRLTAAIEADRRELVEACANEVQVAWDDHAHDCIACTGPGLGTCIMGLSYRIGIARIRSLTPSNPPATPGTAK